MRPEIVDLYHGDTISNFSALASVVKGVIHKASQGLRPDPRYASRRVAWAKAKPGAYWAAYHYLVPGVAMAAQAAAFFKFAAPVPGMDLVVDYEAEGLGFADLDGFIGALPWPEDRIVIYGNPSQLEGAPEGLGEYRLWLAEYGSKYRTPKPWRSPWLWQFSEKVRVRGIANACDGNVYV